MNSANDEVSLDGLRVADAKRAITEWLEASGVGERDRHLQAARLAVQPAALLGRAVPDRLRRARSGRAAGVDAAGRAARDHRLRAARPPTIPTRCPSRRSRARPTGSRSSSTSPGPAWAGYGGGRQVYRRETNTMPQWAGSCWYYLRYLDPTNEDALVDPEVEQLLGRGARRRSPKAGSSTSTSAASSTRCCTCSTRASGTRCSSTSATCRRRSRSSASSTRATSSRPRTPTSAACTSRPTEVEERDGAFFFDGAAGHARVREDGQEPEERGRARRHLPRLRRRHAAALRDVHGPARRSRARGARPTSSACTGSCSGCGATSSTRTTGEVARQPTRRPTTRRAGCCTARSRRCAPTWTSMSFNTAIARLFELNNQLTQVVQQRGARRARSSSRWC